MEIHLGSIGKPCKLRDGHAFFLFVPISGVQEDRCALGVFDLDQVTAGTQSSHRQNQTTFRRLPPPLCAPAKSQSSRRTDRTKRPDAPTGRTDAGHCKTTLPRVVPRLLVWDSRLAMWGNEVPSGMRPRARQEDQQTKQVNDGSADRLLVH